MSESAVSKPRFVAFAVMGMDGFIATGEDDPMEWPSDEDWDFLQKYLGEGVDAVVVGRGSYEGHKESLAKRNAFVFSTKFETTERVEGVTFVNPEGVDVPDLFRGCSKVAVLGGPRVYSYMLKHDMLDEFYLTIEPVFFGTGKALSVGDIQMAAFMLASPQVLNDRGTILLHYQRKKG